jgi:hypothetical protein
MVWLRGSHTPDARGWGILPRESETDGLTGFWVFTFFLLYYHYVMC